jgi:hypothetical protein
MIAVAEWSLFNVVSQNAVSYMFGSYGILALAIILLYFVLVVGSGIEFRYAALFSLPLIAGFSLAGWFAVPWIIHVFIMIAGIFYAVALIKMFG